MRKGLFVIALLVVAAVIITACQNYAPIENQSGNEFPVEIANISADNVSAGEAPAMTEETAPVNGVVIQATEGDLVRLKPEAVDPDNDKVTYFFTPPFDASGKWQTREGDAGQYPVTITASDGKANTTEEITVLVNRAKKGPVIECPDSITVKEGDTINLNCNIYDPEGDQAVVEYSGFMKGPSYTTTFDDAGEYTTVIKASNQYKTTEKTVKITVLNTDRAPELSFGFGDTIQATEGDVITLDAKASDPDGDKVTVKYGEPFDSTGTWKTKIGDAGTYPVTVVASDGTLTARKDVMVVVAMKNTAPVLKKINDITVYEGDTIKVPVDVYDREGDKVKVTIKGWLNSLTYTTTYDDAGEYTATVTASDGQYETSQTFKITVIDRNRPPVFTVPA